MRPVRLQEFGQGKRPVGTGRDEEVLAVRGADGGGVDELLKRRRRFGLGVWPWRAILRPLP